MRTDTADHQGRQEHQENQEQQAPAGEGVKLVIEVTDAARKRGTLRLNGRVIEWGFDPGQGGLYLSSGINAHARDNTPGGYVLKEALRHMVPVVLATPAHRLWGRRKRADHSAGRTDQE